MIKLTKEEKGFIEQVRKRDYRKGGSFVLSVKNIIYHGIAYEALNWIHGEQNAIGSMLTEEGLESKFIIILIVGDSKEILMPCGMCRAAILRYGLKNATVLCSNNFLKKIEKFTISELYPHPYIEKISVSSKTLRSLHSL